MKVEDYLRQSVEEKFVSSKKQFSIPKFVWDTLLMWLVIPKTLLREKKSVITQIGTGLLIILVSFLTGTKFIYKRNLVWTHFDSSFEIIFSIIAGFFLLVIFLTIFSVFLRFFDPTQYMVRKVLKKYQNNSTMFRDTQYLSAAKALENFSTIKHKEAIQKYGEDIVDLLMIAGAVLPMNRELTRIVSLSAIREDRDAGEEE